MPARTRCIFGVSVGDRAKQPGPNPQRSPIAFCALLLLISFSSLANPAVFAQQPTSPTIPEPKRLYTIYVRVSMPDGRPAEGAVVTLVSGSGVPHKAFTNDSGRIEFPGMPEGPYTLSATSPGEPNFSTDTVETNPSRTENGNLTVQLVFHYHAPSRNKPGVVNAAEPDQKIPKAAAKAFNEGAKQKAASEADKALESFSKAIEIFPDFYQARYERGDLYISQRKLDLAEVEFDSALKINPRYAPALRGAGYCKLEKHQFDEAIELFEKSLSFDPDEATTHLMLGIANLELDKREAAKASLTKALLINPPAIRAHIYLANIYAKDHQFKEAADELHKYLELQPTDPSSADLRKVEAQWRARITGP